LGARRTRPRRIAAKGGLQPPPRKVSGGAPPTQPATLRELTISTRARACAKLFDAEMAIDGRGWAGDGPGVGMHAVGWFFSWIDSWTAPYEVMILAGVVAGFLSWTLRASR
jgi:hypothetical protein